jgi:hypothetical protein
MRRLIAFAVGVLAISVVAASAAGLNIWPVTAQVFHEHLTAPAAPDHVDATVQIPPEGGPAVELSWPGASGAASYDVLRAPGAGGGYVLLASVGSPGYVDGAVVEGEAYLYLVYTRGSSGMTSRTGTGTSTTVPTPPAATSAPEPTSTP